MTGKRPAIVDAHCHLFHDLSPVGTHLGMISGDEAPDVLVDAGTFGPDNFEPFSARVRELRDAGSHQIFALVNVARRGLEVIPEITEEADFQPEAAAAVARAHEDFVLGLKLRAIYPGLGLLGVDLLARTIAAAEDAGLVVVVHFGQQDGNRSQDEMLTPQLLDLLRPGDVATHVFTGWPGGVFGSEQSFEAAQRARTRGVVFDVGHGRFNFDIGVARRAAQLGFPADLISSDVTSGTASWLSLQSTMAAVAAAGFASDTIVEAVTTAPLAWIGRSIPGARHIVAVPDDQSRNDSHGTQYDSRVRFDFQT